MFNVFDIKSIFEINFGNSSSCNFFCVWFQQLNDLHDTPNGFAFYFDISWHHWTFVNTDIATIQIVHCTTIFLIISCRKTKFIENLICCFKIANGSFPLIGSIGTVADNLFNRKCTIFSSVHKRIHLLGLMGVKS